MNLTKVFQKYLSNIFISIVQQDGEWIIYSKVVKNGILKDKFTKNFDIKEHDSVPTKMQDYLVKLQDDYSFAYLSVFLDSMGQGAINGISASDFENNSIDIKSVTRFDIDKKWSVYASFIDLNWIKNLFSDVGIDFIYSPFMVQYSLIKKQKTKNKPILYMLNYQDSVTISVFDSNHLLFGAYFKTTTDDELSSSDEEDWENVEEEESIENIIDLDGIDDDDIGGTEDLESLNEFDDLDDETESTDFDERLPEDSSLGHFDDKNIADESSLELFGRDVLIYKYLKSSLQEFYTNSLYESSFIDTIVIFDGYEISSEFIDMIENELLMDIEMNKVNISDTICTMARQEALS